jgi:hypothetical protein
MPQQQSWKVKLFEATGAPPGGTTPTARFLENFGVTANNVDGARKAAKDWLVARKRSVRAVSLVAGEDRTLVAYVMPLASKTKGAT